MRTIRFRGKRIDTGEWVYGNLIQWPNGDCEICTPNSEVGMSKISVNPDSVGEFSGKADNDGGNICEGDILMLQRWWRDQEGQQHQCVGEVFYSDGAFFIENHDGDGECLYLTGMEDESCEIIGNIHDNPELLKGGEQWK